jgi:hypothetical protein
VTATLPSTPQAESSITFILPTRNRRQWVIRAIESCLRVHQPDIPVEVLVIDGNSTDGSWELLQQRFAADPRVRLIRQHGEKGFMAACFLAVPLVRSLWATFMYDDDVLSPHWVALPRGLRRHRVEFAFGFGKLENMERVFAFEPVDQPMPLPPHLLLRAYCGWGRPFRPLHLPVSPICCLTQTSLLQDWVVEVQRFTAGQPLRHHFLLERNAGPDLMIYLLSLLRLHGQALLFRSPVAQFSTHETSMTVQFETTDRRLGYWLPRVWLCDEFRRQGRHADAGVCAAHVIKKGLQLLWARLRLRNWSWLSSFGRELCGLAVRTLASRSAPALLGAALTLFLPRSWRPGSGWLKARSAASERPA